MPLLSKVGIGKIAARGDESCKSLKKIRCLSPLVSPLLLWAMQGSGDASRQSRSPTKGGRPQGDGRSASRGADARKAPTPTPPAPSAAATAAAADDYAVVSAPPEQPHK